MPIWPGKQKTEMADVITVPQCSSDASSFKKENDWARAWQCD